jgi:hypothetical protein
MSALIFEKLPAADIPFWTATGQDRIGKNDVTASYGHRARFYVREVQMKVGWWNSMFT